MQQSLTISENLYQRLQMTAQENGLPSIEQLLDYWQRPREQLEAPP